MPEFSRRVDVDIIKDEPMTYEDFWHVHDRNLSGDSFYQQYLDRFQPYRWRAESANGEVVAIGESYFNEADAINAVELLFGDDTTMYWRSREPERGDQLLRFGKTDRDSQ